MKVNARAVLLAISFSWFAMQAQAVPFFDKKADPPPQPQPLGLQTGAQEESKSKFSLPKMPWSDGKSKAAGPARPVPIAGKNVSPEQQLEGQISLARLAERRGQEDQAEQMYRTLIERHPALIVPRHRLGVIESRRGNYEQADVHFQFALKQEPRNLELLRDAGYACYLQNRFEEAEALYQRAYAIAPNDKRLCNNYGMLLAEIGRIDEALPKFRKATNEAQAFGNVGYVLVQQGQHDEARKYFDHALTLEPTLRPAAHALLQLAGQQEKARIAARSPQRQQPNDSPLVPIEAAEQVAMSQRPATEIPASLERPDSRGAGLQPAVPAPVFAASPAERPEAPRQIAAEPGTRGDARTSLASRDAMISTKSSLAPVWAAPGRTSDAERARPGRTEFANGENVAQTTPHHQAPTPIPAKPAALPVAVQHAPDRPVVLKSPVPQAVEVAGKAGPPAASVASKMIALEETPVRPIFMPDALPVEARGTHAPRIAEYAGPAGASIASSRRQPSDPPGSSPASHSTEVASKAIVREDSPLKQISVPEPRAAEARGTQAPRAADYAGTAPATGQSAEFLKPIYRSAEDPLNQLRAQRQPASDATGSTAGKASAPSAATAHEVARAINVERGDSNSATPPTANQVDFQGPGTMFSAGSFTIPSTSQPQAIPVTSRDMFGATQTPAPIMTPQEMQQEHARQIQQMWAPAGLGADPFQPLNLNPHGAPTSTSRQGEESGRVAPPASNDYFRHFSTQKAEEPVPRSPVRPLR